MFATTFTRRARRRLLAGFTRLLALSLVLAPASAEASQTSSQTTTGNTNQLASMLSTAVGVLSVAQGALSIKKGTEQFSCCTKGCTGAGEQSVKEKAAQDTSAKEGSKKVAETAVKDTEVKTPPGYGWTDADKPAAQPAKRVAPEFNHRFPDSASASSYLRLHLSLLDRFLSPRVATASGCTDALLAIATGGVMLLSGMLGLMAAMQASKNADAAYDNASNLGLMDPTSGSGTSGLVDPTGGSSIGGGGGSGSGVGTGTSGSGPSGANLANSTKAPGSSITIDPALLRNGTAGQVMSQFEKQFGIDRDQFAADLAAGKDPRDLLASAPQNPISRADLAKAESAANGLSDSQKAAALGNAELAAAQKELLANAGFGKEDSAYEAGSRKTASTGASTSGEALSEADLMPGGLQEGTPNLALSPEIKAALAEQQASNAAKSHVDTSLFEVVHRKYMEKAKMISGAGIPGGRSAGI